MKRWITLCLALSAPLVSCAEQTLIRYVPTGGSRGGGLFEVEPLGEQDQRTLARRPIEFVAGSKLFAVRVELESTDDVPEVAGTYRIAGDKLQFEPRFPLTPGVVYRAVFRSGPDAVVQRVVLPLPDATPTSEVEAVYPSSDVLPENLLKFYIYFSAPMSRGQAWEHLILRDGAGARVEFPFLELDEELWDRGVSRLTVLIDPGRIKRGLRPLEEVGPALSDTQSYVLEIHRDWQDAAAKPLKKGFRKRFRVGPADRTPPDPAAWTLTSPRIGGRERLVVNLRESLDHGLLQSGVWVAGPQGEGVDGQVEIDDNERSWSFIPAQSWVSGAHHLVVATTLEDLAGNSIGRPFEVDALEPVQQRIEVDVEKIPFRPVEPTAE